VRVLDVGSGRRPAIAIEQRPDNCTYVGLDIVGEELAIAPPGAYTDTWTADITEPLPNELREQFDVVISFQAIEHVDSVPRALREMRAALRPGGLLVFQTSGAFGILPAMVNRVLPRRASLWLLRRLTGRDPETVFPAVYDQCWASALRRLLTSWQNVQVLPREWGGFYLLSAPYLLWPYLLWEELVRRAGWENLATHYLVAAELPGAPASTEIRE
jgi:SAM-dependent methyltransferase